MDAGKLLAVPCIALDLRPCFSKAMLLEALAVVRVQSMVQFS